MVTTMPLDEQLSRGKGSQDLADQANALLSQLNHAGQIRSAYETQLLNLQVALQSERKNKGEHQLKLHELEQAIQGLKRNEAELLSQIEHWRRKAQTAMEQRALASSQPESQAQILQDIERLQQGEAYWRRQASHLTHQYEQAEDDVRRLIREVQTRAEMIKDKENTERALRQEINALTQRLRESMSAQNSPRAEMHSKYSSRSQLHYENEAEDASNFARVVKLQTLLLHQGNYEEAERLALSFHENPSIIQEIEGVKGHANYGSAWHRETNYLQTPRSERTAHINWNRSNVSVEISPNSATSNQPNSTAPPLYQKLALENRLASFPHSSSISDPENRWAVKIGILEAINMPSVGAEILQECYACVSLLHAEADLSSPQVKSLEHIHGNHGSRSWLLGQIHGIAWIQGHLKVRAMGKTSSIKYANNAAHWAEAFILRAIHADAFEATNSMSEFSSESMPLDGRPAVILVTVHQAREDVNGKLLGRASLRIRPGEEFHQWYKLHDTDGKPLLAGPSKPAMIRIRSAYTRNSFEEQVHDKSISPPRVEDRHQSPSSGNTYQNDDNFLRQRSGESATVVSATLGFFSMTPESDGDTSTQQSVLHSKSAPVRTIITTTESASSAHTSPMPVPVPPTYHAQEIREVDLRQTSQQWRSASPSSTVTVVGGAGTQATQRQIVTIPGHQLPNPSSPSAHDISVGNEAKGSETLIARNPVRAGTTQTAVKVVDAVTQPAELSSSSSPKANSPPSSHDSVKMNNHVVAGVPLNTSSPAEDKPSGQKVQDTVGQQPYVLPRAKVLPVQQVSPFKLQELAAGNKNSKGAQNRPLSSKVADTIAKLDNSRKPITKDPAISSEETQTRNVINQDPDHIIKRGMSSSDASNKPENGQSPSRQDLKSGPAPADRASDSSVQWVSKTIELTRTAPAGKQGAERVGVGIAIASHGTGQPFVSALAPNGPAKLSGQIFEGDKIISVNGRLVAGMNVYNIIQLILGEPGSVVRLDIETATSDGVLKGSGYLDTPRQRSPTALESRQTPSKVSEEVRGNQNGAVAKSQTENVWRSTATPSSSIGSKQLNVSTVSETTDAQGSISVKVLKATKLRLLSGDRKPHPFVQLRISGGIPPESRYKTAKATDTTTPEWNETITLPILDVDRAQLECSLWDEQTDLQAAKHNENFLGEVVLNLAKLKPYQGKYIEQVFEVKPSKVYQCAHQATGKLKLGLKLDVPPVGPFSKPWK